MKNYFAVLALAVGGCVAEPTDDAELVAEAELPIVGGAATTKYAAVGALMEGGQPFCTGTLIAKRIVLTAAHCLVGMRAANLRFVLGSNAYAPTTTLRVARLKPHPAYDDAESRHDIGIVELTQDAAVAPIPANTGMRLDQSWVGRSVTFVGYGVTNGRTEVGAGKKREVAIPISEVNATDFVNSKRNVNTCMGDSGGPALAKNASGTTVVVGITSWGDDYCTQFGVNTRVDSYRTFISQSLP